MIAAANETPGPIALVGSGEFLPQMVEVDRWLLNGRLPRAAFLPTAAGEEGPVQWRGTGRVQRRSCCPHVTSARCSPRSHGR